MLNEIVSNIGHISEQLNMLTTYTGSIIGSIGAISLTISGITAWLAALLPVPRKNNAYSKVYNIINTLGGNVGNAANAIKGVK